MPIELAEVTTFSDFDELIPLLWKAYAKPRYPLLWLTFAVTSDAPEALAEGVASSQKAYMHAHKEDPTSRYLKVTDTETGKIVAGSCWHLCEKHPEDDGKGVRLSEKAWGEGEGRRFAAFVLGQIGEQRRARYRGSYMNLQMVFVDPEYRRRGAGKLMLDWGTKKADELRLQCFIESPSSAVPFFETADFKVVKVDVTNVHRKDASEGWKAMQRRFELTFSYAMWRPIQGKFVPGVTKMPF